MSLFFNQQANIKNVNGAIADTIANRPAAQSTYYIFYSTDTQEIFYDNGSWVLLGSGGGGAVNIYNSDGTLTGNRELVGNGNELRFTDLNQFYVQTNSSFTAQFVLSDTQFRTIYNTNSIGLFLDFANQSYLLGDSGSFAGGNYFIVDDANGRITTGNNAGINGIDLNFGSGFSAFGFLTTTNSTQININDAGKIKTIFGGITTGIELDFLSRQYILGEIATNNQTYLSVNDNNSLIITHNQGNEQGLYIDYNAQIYCLGISDGNDFYNTITGYKLDQTNSVITIGDNWVSTLTHIQIDYSANQIIKTSNQGNDIGLKLDFANEQFYFGGNNDRGLNVNILSNQYLLGDYNGFNNGTAFLIDDSSNFENIKTTYQGNDIGLKLDFANNIYKLGDYNGNILYDTNVTVDSTNSFISMRSNGSATEFLLDDLNQIIKTSNQGNDIGLKLDFANNEYRFGDVNNHNYLISNNNGIYLGDYFANFNTTIFLIDDTNNLIKTINQAFDKGIYLDFANTTYKYGQLTGGNTTYLYINDTSELLYTANNGNISNGLYCDFASHIYQFGRSTGGNTTYLTINDAATYPLQIDGTNVLSGTSGGNSGQHLKININGVDYKIKLENP